MKHAFCTIITADYFFYAKSIYDSLKIFNENLIFKVLVVDNTGIELEYKNIEVISLQQLEDNLPKDFNSLKKYDNDKKSNFRWALKPLFLKYILTHREFDKAVFVDPDIYFFDNPAFLISELHEKDVILTPHWRSKSPNLDSDNFNKLFTEGLFNAGFFGCNTNAINILDWWMEACAYKMEKSKGFYVDQAYLNLMPIYFESQVKVIQHKGCNVSNWNLVECERSLSNEGVVINNQFPVIFIHFTDYTIDFILNGKDELLQPFLKKYMNSLLFHNAEYNFKIIEKNTNTHISKPSFFRKLKNIFKGL